MKPLFAIIAFLPLCGCAHMAEVLDNPTVEHDELNLPGHILIQMTGDRRLIRTSVDGAGRLQVCAETQADAMSARSAASALEVVGKGALTDEIAERLTVTYARTELSDVVRQLAWHFCNAHLNGQMSVTAYQAAMLSMQEQAMLVLANRADVDNAALIKEIADRNIAGAAADQALELARAQEAAERTVARLKQQQLQACLTAAGSDAVAISKCLVAG